MSDHDSLLTDELGPGYRFYAPEDIHTHMGLSYANYMVLPRSVLQSMPENWQRQFCLLLADLQHASDLAGIPTPVHGYRVQAVDRAGRFTEDGTPHYDRGRADVLGNEVRARLDPAVTAPTPAPGDGS